MRSRWRSLPRSFLGEGLLGWFNQGIGGTRATMIRMPRPNPAQRGRQAEIGATAFPSIG